ncbi:hypothetical protein DSO57_1002165 [Entomophthora muscae]|uniref:Uncharacterized protein n=1 Tax=Entomophthora muscae TaxID=34485 RepID=A0ACC2T8Z6_9FUNG|nr:hypothetical protein DSO57_1002165 [Entomophthora muscae]
MANINIDTVAANNAHPHQMPTCHPQVHASLQPTEFSGPCSPALASSDPVDSTPMLLCPPGAQFGPVYCTNYTLNPAFS